MQNFAESSSDLNTILGSLFTLWRYGIGTLESLTKSMGRYSGVARLAGLSIQQFSALLAVLVEKGTPAARAANVLARNMSAWVKNRSSVIRGLKQLGIEIDKNTEKTMTWWDALSLGAKKLLEVKQKNTKAAEELMRRLVSIIGSGYYSATDVIQKELSSWSRVEEIAEATSRGMIEMYMMAARNASTISFELRQAKMIMSDVFRTAGQDVMDWIARLGRGLVLMSVIRLSLQLRCQGLRVLSFMMN